MSETWRTVTGAWVLPQLQPIFPDSEEMKEKVRNSLMKPAYNVADLYKDKGIWQRIARSPWFENITLAVIAANAIWLAIDADQNQAEVPLEAEPVFQVAEHTFCTYFLFEWIVRFLAFKRKRDAMKDGWFAFDSVLVLAAILETWVLAMVLALSGGSGGLRGSTTLRLARLMRLTRMARMARLLRALPELMILIKGMRAAFRSVFLTLGLLVLVIYVFAIAFTQLTADTAVGAQHFATVAGAMYTLLMRGTFLDNIGALVSELGAESMLAAGLFLFFVLLAALTIMNMLIGVLCEVVSVVAAVEKEEMAVAFVKRKLADIVEGLDQDRDKQISKEEFEKILRNPEATKALQEVDVDVVGLVDLADVIFRDDNAAAFGGDGLRQLDFCKFMEVVLQLRGTNTATVKDIVTLRKYLRTTALQTSGQLEQTNCRLARIEDKLRAAFPELHDVSRRPSIARAFSGSSGFSRASTRPSRSPSPGRQRAKDEQWSAKRETLRKANTWQDMSTPTKEPLFPDASPGPEPRRKLSVVERRMSGARPSADAEAAKARASTEEPKDMQSRISKLESMLNLGLSELQKVLSELDGRLEHSTASAVSGLPGLARDCRRESSRRRDHSTGSSSSRGSAGQSTAHLRLPAVPGIPESPSPVKDHSRAETRPAGGGAGSSNWQAEAASTAPRESAAKAGAQAADVALRQRAAKLGEAVSAGLTQLQRSRSRESLHAAAAGIAPPVPAAAATAAASPSPEPVRRKLSSDLARLANGRAADCAWPSPGGPGTAARAEAAASPPPPLLPRRLELSWGGAVP